jgi:hypothetical protein
VPDDSGSRFVVESTPVIPRRGTPSKVICHVERLRGPVRVEAVFDGGKIIFSMFSFEPGLPFERRDKPRG